MEKKKFFNSARYILLVLSIACFVFAIFFLKRFVTSHSDSELIPVEPVEVEHRVLFLSSYNPFYFTYIEQVKGLSKGLYPHGIEYDVLYMDAKNYSSKRDIKDFYAFIKSRLENRSDYEAVLLGDDNALLFALEYQEELFKDLPLVYFGINDLTLAQTAALNSYATGFYENDFLGQNIELAMKLFPKSKKFYALHDNSIAGKAGKDIFMSYAERLPTYSFTPINTTSFSQDELILYLETLPEDSILFYMTCYIDKLGNTYSMLSRTNTIATHVKVPVFRNYVGGEGLGVLGGVYLDFEEQCGLAAETVASILDGENVARIPLNMQSPSKTSFDWQLVKKYDLDISLLPEDVVFYNKPQTFFERYGSIFVVSLFIILGLLLLLASTNITNLVRKDLLEELKTSQKKLIYQAEYDDYLEVVNRRTMTDYLLQNKLPYIDYSVVMLDIDGFKDINENFGHKVADSLLKQYANSFIEFSKTTEALVARYGGDEFLLLIPNVKLTLDHDYVMHIKGIIQAPLRVGSGSYIPSASIGIANSDGVSSPLELVNAETAMYEAKNRGRNGAFIYGDKLKQKNLEEQKIKAKLQEALTTNGFYMLYQPKVDAKTKEVTGYEALVRMKDPCMFPGQFIPVAERNGFIAQIGRITTELVVKQLALWKEQGANVKPVSVNYSSYQLNDTGYIEYLKSLLENYHVEADLLQIEITESLFIERTTLAEDVFRKFKSMGIKLLMDDFGTGYSSLGYLTYIPVDIIKLDKSLVDAYLVDGKDSFIKDVICLVHDLNKEIIIEGVEEKSQYDKLREFGADSIQGYYFSKPILPEEAISFKVSAQE